MERSKSRASTGCGPLLQRPWHGSSDGRSLPERARQKSWGQRDEEAGMQQLRTGLPRRAAGRHDGASLRIPRRRSGANTSEAGRNPDAAAKYLLWKDYPAISDGHGRLRRRNAASMVPRILHSETTLAETGRSCALSAGDSLPALTMAGWPYTLYIRAYARIKACKQS